MLSNGSATRRPAPKRLAPHAFTLVELAVAMLIAIIPILVVGTIIAGSQRQWKNMYDRTNSPIATAVAVTTRVFDTTIRKAAADQVLIDPAGKWIEVCYPGNPNSATIDSYARFYAQKGSLHIDRGRLNPRTSLTDQTLCENVSSCSFRQLGQSVQMILKLDDSTEQKTIISSALMHN